VKREDLSLPRMTWKCSREENKAKYCKRQLEVVFRIAEIGECGSCIEAINLVGITFVSIILTKHLERKRDTKRNLHSQHCFDQAGQDLEILERIYVLARPRGRAEVRENTEVQQEQDCFAVTNQLVALITWH
jgi:hypothetical protein